MAESWCKVASNLDSHPKIRKAGRNGREVFLFALRRNAEPGIAVPGMLAGAIMEPWYLADQLMMREADAVDGLARAVSAGLLVHEDCAWRIVGWDTDEWGKRDAADSRRQGGLNRAKSAMRGPTGAFVPADSQVAGQVAGDRAQVAGVQLDQVKPGHPAGPGRGEEKRGEETRREESESVASLPPRRRGTPLPADWKPSVSAPNGAAVDKATARGVDIAEELEKMRDWAAAKGETGKDWDARWRLWLRNARPAQGANGQRKTPFELQMERIAMLEEQERQAAGGQS